METPRFKGAELFSVMFKSYYVVWKRETQSRNEISHAKFKSYYVVWKRFWTYSQKKSFSLFKSYYVVWKHILDIDYFFSRYCLNRTM